MAFTPVDSTLCFRAPLVHGPEALLPRWPAKHTVRASGRFALSGSRPISFAGSCGWFSASFDGMNGQMLVWYVPTDDGIVGWTYAVDSLDSPWQFMAIKITNVEVSLGDDGNHLPAFASMYLSPKEEWRHTPFIVVPRTPGGSWTERSQILEQSSGPSTFGFWNHDAIPDEKLWVPAHIPKQNPDNPNIEWPPREFRFSDAPA